MEVGLPFQCCTMVVYSDGESLWRENCQRHRFICPCVHANIGPFQQGNTHAGKTWVSPSRGPRMLSEPILCYITSFVLKAREPARFFIDFPRVCILFQIWASLGRLSASARKHSQTDALYVPKRVKQLELAFLIHVQLQPPSSLAITCDFTTFYNIYPQFSNILCIVYLIYPHSIFIHPI